MGKNGQQLAYFYLDLYPREGKFTHAAVFDISSGGSSRQELPICSMVANFPNPNTGDGLMTFDEVETLFMNLAMFYTMELENQNIRDLLVQAVNGTSLKHQVKLWSIGYGK